MNNPIIFETRRRLNGTDFGYVACEVQHDLGTFRLGMMWQTLCRRGVPMGYQPRQPVYDRPDHGLGTGLRDPRAHHHRHFCIDLTSSESKCCSPNLECRDCRAYAMASGTAVSRFRQFLSSYEAFCDWVSIAEQWSRLFMHDWDSKEA
jgi:hypothetical protein